MAAAESDKYQKVAIGTATTLSAPGKALAATSITVGSTANFPTTTGITFAIRVVDGNGELVAGTYTEWVGTVSSGTTLAMNAVPVYGSDQVYTAGSTTQVYVPLSSYSYNKHIDADLVHADQDGTLKAGAVDVTAVIADGIITRAKLATAVTTEMNTDWKPGLLPAVNSVTENGNRSADITFASTVASILTPGMRIRTSRTVAAPTQCTDLESGSSQYFSKASPNKLTFIDDFTCMGWVKVESYTKGGIIARRNADTEGWSLYMDTTGQIIMESIRIAGNYSTTTSYQSLPLNKWVHVAATTDLSGTSVLIYIDGVLVPSATVITGTITALVQGTTALVVGAVKSAGTNPFDGKIAQAAVFDAVLSASTIRSYKNQTLSGSETNLKSAYSFNNVITDLNTTTPNDLTANGAAVATNADSPFTADANGVPGGTYDWAIVTKVATTVATVQYPEGCAIPTSGGISTVDYSGVKAPFGMPVDAGRWEITVIIKTNVFQAAVTTGVVYNPGGIYISKPIGKFAYSHDATPNLTGTTDAAKTLDFALSTSNSAFSTGTENQSRHHFYIISDVARITAYKNPFVLDEVAATTYYALFNGAGTGTLSSLGFIGTTAQSILTLTPAGL